MTREEMQQQILDAIASGKISPTTIILGDNVQSQHNIHKVEAGGIGVKIIYQNGEEQTDEPATTTQEQARPAQPEPQQEELTDGPIDLHLQLFRQAMLKVQDIKYSEIKFAKAIMNSYEWQAVIRLGQDIGLMEGYTDLITLMKGGDFKCVPTNPQNVNPYRKHINPEPLYPNWQFSHPASEPFFRKFKFIADNTYSLYKLACAKHHIKPFGICAT